MMQSQVSENAEQKRFELPIDGDAIAAAYYRPDEGRVVLIHTEVPKKFSRQGIATHLAWEPSTSFARLDARSFLDARS